MREGVILLLVLALGGCAAPNAGTATSPVTINLSGAHFCGTATTTISVTITPTSEARQDAKADGKVDVTLPIK